jgi:hypothetical protein
MGEKVLEASSSRKQSGSRPDAKRDILIGICLFVGMNLMFMLGGHILRNFFWRIDSAFFGRSVYFLRIFDGVYLALILFINLALFIYLIIKRPMMTVGILSGIPVLLLILVLLWLALCLFVVLAWFTLLFLHGLGLI